MFPRRIKPGDICIFDAENKLDLAGVRVTWVKVIKISKDNLFYDKSIYDCVVCDQQGNVINENIISVPGNKLVPNGSVGDNVVYRYQEDIPILNSEDVRILTLIFDKYLNDLDNPDQLALAKLLTKVKFFSSIIHNY